MVTRIIALTLAVFIAGCGVRVSNETSSGRDALRNGNPEVAVSFFKRGAESQPNYIVDTPPLRQSIWTYLGRAYFSTGQLGEAKAALSRGLQSDSSDFLARLYLGIISVREAGPSASPKGENALGLTEMLYALKEKVSPRRVAALVKERGTNVELTADLERELRRAGADDELVGQIRSSSPVRSGSFSAGPTQPGVREIERALKEIQSWQLAVRKSALGRSWDSRKQISARVDNGLAMIAGRRTDRPEFLSSLEPLGHVIDEEVDLTRGK